MPQLGRAAQALGRRDEALRLGRGGSQLLVLKYSLIVSQRELDHVCSVSVSSQTDVIPQ